MIQAYLGSHVLNMQGIYITSHKIFEFQTKTKCLTQRIDDGLGFVFPFDGENIHRYADRHDAYGTDTFPRLLIDGQHTNGQTDDHETDGKNKR